MRRAPDEDRAVGIGLLGPLRVDDRRTLEPRDRIALSVFAVRHGHVVSPDELADALWRGTPPPTWHKQVQICVARLRKTLGASAIETVPGGYRLALDGDDLDTARFERLAERGRALAATGDAARAASAFARALALWRGHPLEELDGWPPGRSEAARLEELRRTIEEDLLDARLAAGEHRRVAVDAEALVAEQPWRERRWAILALARYRCGRQADALASIRAARRTLVEDLGLDPGSELADLERAILRQDPALAAPPEPAAVSEACPYKGLAPYAVGDAEGFFGRDAEVVACLERLRTSPLLVLAGPSGCGKSSLLRAGLAPALQQRGRAPVVLAPGPDPGIGWAVTVASIDPGAPVLVDQFEELFAFGATPDAVRSFGRQIVERARDNGPVVVAVRSDHLGGFAVDEELSRMAERGLHLVSPLSGDALREAIEQPALRAGLRVESGLIDVLVRDSEGEPGALPLLSHALVETWKRRDGSVLTVDGYRETGGIRGPSRGRPTGSTTAWARSSGRCCARSCCGSSRPRSTAIRCAAACPAACCWAIRVASESSRCSSARGWSRPSRRRSSWPTRRSRAPGRVCSPGSTRTSPASASCATWRRPPTGGTRSAGRRASCTAVRGSKRRSNGARPRSRTSRLLNAPSSTPPGRRRSPSRGRWPRGRDATQVRNGGCARC